jgi:ComEC/Rec2-related protein
MDLEAELAGGKSAHPGGVTMTRLSALPGAIRGELPGAINERSPVAFEVRRRSPLAQYRARLGEFLATSVREEADYGHLFYWSPVLLGAGAALWFAVPVPWPIQGLVFVLVLSIIAFVFAGYYRTVWRSVAMISALLATGALLATMQTVRQDTIVLDSAVTTTIKGIVRGKESDSNGRWRYEIRLLGTEKPVLRRLPLNIKVTALGNGVPLELGAGIEGRARLSPPSGPALIGLNDFAFDAYFDGTGAFGYFYGQPRLWTPPIDHGAEVGVLHGIAQGLEALRNHIGARIHSVLPGDTGAFAASMVTDDRRAISKETTEALRLAGLAHIVAISGLNMALAAGIFFVGLRWLLSLSQELSHSLPVKKIAAGGALVTVTGYYLISGFAVSAERAYIMMVIMLAAVFFGRPSISLRNVGLSALFILVMSPSAVMGPGFQMSYAATLALVAGYAAFQRRTSRVGLLSGFPILRPVLPVWNFAAGIFMTSLIGGLSTALFSIEHFHRLAAWGLPANLLAMPVISFIVMPAGVIALMLMPFGMDWLPLKIMGYGLDIVLWVANWAASLDGDIVVGRIPGWLFVGMTMALILLAIMRSRLRYMGIGLGVALVALFYLLPAEIRPDIVVFEDGSLGGITTGEAIAISESRPSEFIAEQWQRALNAPVLVKPIKATRKSTVEAKPKDRRLTPEQIATGRKDIARVLAMDKTDRFICRDRHWCAATLSSGWKIVIAENGGYTGMACDLADIVVTPARLKWDGCRSGALLFTGESLRRSGSVEIFLPAENEPPENIRLVNALETAARPWDRHRLYDWHTDGFPEDKPAE